MNKVNSKATLRWPIFESTSLPVDVRSRFIARHGTWVTKQGHVLITSQEHRDQPQNIASCLTKLKQLLASVATAPRRRIKTKPTRSSRQKRLDLKQHRSNTKSMRRGPADRDG